MGHYEAQYAMLDRYDYDRKIHSSLIFVLIDLGLIDEKAKWSNYSFRRTKYYKDNYVD